MNTKITVGVIVLVLAVGGAAFYAGMQNNSASVQPVPVLTSQTPAAGAAYTSSVAGVVTAKTATSISLKLLDGSTKIFVLSTTTQVFATVAAGQTVPTLATLPPNALVSLSLYKDGNGTVTVRSINIAPSSIPAANTK
jgi:hypothetical protein